MAITIIQVINSLTYIVIRNTMYIVHCCDYPNIIMGEVVCATEATHLQQVNTTHSFLLNHPHVVLLWYTYPMVASSIESVSV